MKCEAGWRNFKSVIRVTIEKEINMEKKEIKTKKNNFKIFLFF
jgi:hypothetical protein